MAPLALASRNRLLAKARARAFTLTGPRNRISPKLAVIFISARAPPLEDSPMDLAWPGLVRFALAVTLTPFKLALPSSASISRLALANPTLAKWPSDETK